MKYLAILVILLTLSVNAYSQAIPRTGQTISHRTGDDGYYQIGYYAYPRFIDNGDGTITDNLTNLMWSRNANRTGIMVWNDALDFAGALYLGGELCDIQCGVIDPNCFSDWRLPNVRELSSLIDYSQNMPALPVGHPFTDVVSNNGDGQVNRYWTSTTTVPENGATGFAWSVDFYAGLTNQHNDKGATSQRCYVWAVRSAN